MTKVKLYILYLAPFIGAFLYTFLQSRRSSYLAWIDGLTYCSLLLLIVSGVLFIRDGKFFTAFADSCKRFIHSIRKKEAYVREREGSTRHAVFQSPPLPVLPFFKAGIFYFLLSLILSTLYIQ